MRIISIDPGETAGWATCTLGEDYVGPGETGLVVRDLVHDSTPMLAFWRGYDKAMKDPERRFQVTIYESWKLTRHGAKVLVGSDMRSSQLIGMIRASYLQAKDAGATLDPLIHVPPAAKSVVDAWFGGPDYLPVSDVDHNRDALRHLFYYLHKEKGFDLEYLRSLLA